MKKTLLIIPALAASVAASGQSQPEATDTSLTIKEVTVTSVRRRNTEAAMVETAKRSSLVVSAISAQEIKKTQDANASEVIRRVPGVSVIEDKFVMVRGLSQRYNNVWINGGAAPSSEADSRAFSFDIIPSAQIDNLMIIKSPSPEYPADFTGGFININTKDIPSRNAFSVTAGTSFNDQTCGRVFTSKNEDDWRTSTSRPVADLKASCDWSLRHRWQGYSLGMTGALNYTNEHRLVSDMQNNLFGVYDLAADRSNYLRRSTDEQSNHNQRLGGMLNFTLLSPSGDNKYEFKNIVNAITNDRYTWRTGLSAQSNREASAEYYRRKRLTYNAQFTGKHTLSEQDKADWSAAYSYANRRLPNRRRYLVDDALTDDGTLGLTSANDINIENTSLDEHIMSGALNASHDFTGRWQPQVKVGAYGEYRTRSYTTEEHMFNWDATHNTLPRDFRTMPMQDLLSDMQYRGADKLHIIEDPHMRNNYDGHNTLVAGYVAATLPFGPLRVYAGLRYEWNRMELVSNTRDYEPSPSSRFYKDADVFPSVNATYTFSDKQQLRFAYGKSVNRAEFREVSSSVYYDFDLASSVQGNSELQQCTVHNLDLRYEFYPNRGEVLSLAVFYKRFRRPIEWTYTVAGGTDLIYSFENAESADNYGIEVDIRKTLDFLGLPQFSLSFNGSLIKSTVNFPAGSRYEDRPMQGQSPYLVNTGVFYSNPRLRLTAALLYNRIGKRIIGVGRSEGTTGNDDNARIPDSYEMPRDMVDLTLSKTFGDHLEVKAAVRDLFGQKVEYKQFATSATGAEVEEITRQYAPGRNMALSITYKW